MEDLKQRTLQAGIAKLGAQAIGFVLRIGSLMILARLLDPKDFGVVGMVTVVTGAFSLLRDAGLSTATVQRAVVTKGEISGLFWINVLVGFGLATLLVAVGPLLAAFYGEPRLVLVTVAFASGFVFTALGVQHSAVLQRQMRFVALAAVETFALMASISVGIGMALAGLGYWALVAMTVVVPVASTIGFWLADPWLPESPRRQSGLAAMIRFGGTITLNSVVVYLAYNVDKLLIGKLWGAEALGIYGRAYQLISIPTENLNSAIGGVAVAALSRLQDDLERFQNVFLKGYSVVLALTIPITACCALFAADIVVVLLGEKWKDAVPTFRFLAPTIVTFALINPLAWVLFSTGRVRLSLNMALVIAPVVILGYLAGLPYGPNGVAIGYSLGMALLAVPMIIWALKDTGIDLREVFRTVKKPLVSAVVAAPLSVGVGLCCHAFAPLSRLFLEVATMFGVYGWMLFHVGGQKHFYANLARDLLGQSRRGPSHETNAAVLNSELGSR